MTDFLFARPSAVYGFSRVLDLGALLDVYNQSPTPAAADFWALLSDWTVTGDDLIVALEHGLKEFLKKQAVNKP